MAHGLPVQVIAVLALGTRAISIGLDTVPRQPLTHAPAIDIVPLLALLASSSAPAAVRVEDVPISVLVLVLEAVVVVVHSQVADVVASGREE